jgi:hypothetical protein
VWKLEAARANESRGNGNGNGKRGNDDFNYRDDPRPTDLMGAGGRDDDLPF